MRLDTAPSRRTLRAAAVLAAVALVLGACGGGGDAVEPAGISGSEVMVRGLDNTTAEDRAASCDGLRLAGADLVVEAMLAEPDVPDDLAAADPDELADALAAFCEDPATDG